MDIQKRIRGHATGSRTISALFRALLVAALIIAASVIITRMILKPSSPPLNAEGWYGLVLTTVLLRSTARSAVRRHITASRAAVAALAAVAVIVLAYWTTPRIYFLSDDFVIVKMANGPLNVASLFTTAGGDGFFRPVGYLSLSMSAPWAGLSPVKWHVAALTLHLVNSLLVYALARRFCIRLFSIFAACLFAIHGTRPETAVWIAGRFDLIATFFVISGLLLFARSYVAMRGGVFYRIGALGCMVLGILSKESAYVFPVLAAMILLATVGATRARIWHLFLFGITALALFLYRLALFNGIGGYHDAQSGAAQALVVGPSTLKALLVRVPMALYFPVNWTSRPGGWLLALLVIYVVAMVGLLMVRPNIVAVRFAVGFVFVAALPPLHLLGIGAGLGNSRLLYLPSVGFALLLAAAAESLPGKARFVFAAVVLAFHFAALTHNLETWKNAAEKGRQSCITVRRCTSNRGLTPSEAATFPRTWSGVPFFANGLQECVEMAQPGTIDQISSARRVKWDSETAEVQCAAD